MDDERFKRVLETMEYVLDQELADIGVEGIIVSLGQDNHGNRACSIAVKIGDDFLATGGTPEDVKAGGDDLLYAYIRMAVEAHRSQRGSNGRSNGHIAA